MKHKNAINYLAALCFSIILIAITACNKSDNQSPSDSALTPYELHSPSYFPALEIPADNPLTLEGIELGRKLYYDPILSNDGRACASCHTQANSFSNSPTVPNSMPHVNLAWNHTFLWNGKVEGTLEQIMDFEVNVFFQTDINKLNQHAQYPEMFKQIFNSTPITSKQITYALAQFIRTQASTNSKFDQYMRKEVELTTSERNGFVIYNSEKGDCFHCHSLGLFNDNAFHNIGLDSIITGNMGRYEITKNTKDMGKFKTPTLRNIDLTPPYMHDGRFSTLEEVIEHYNSGVKHSSTLDPIFSKPNQIFGLQLTYQEKADLMAFLRTLTDTDFTSNPKLSKP